MREYLNIENARLIFNPNFSGVGDKFNKEGNRNFNIILEDPAVIEKLVSEGWNVKKYTPEDGDDIFFLNVTVAYGFQPPKVYMVIGKKTLLLSEEMVGELDNMDISCIDLVINPYHWEVNGKTGIKAYLKTAYVNVIEDPYAGKYKQSDISDSEEDRPF